MTTTRTSDARPAAFHKTWNDAGLLRQYLTRHHGAILTYGGETGRYFDAVRLAKRLARLADLPLDEVIATIGRDFNAMEA